MPNVHLIPYDFRSCPAEISIRTSQGKMPQWSYPCFQAAIDMVKSQDNPAALHFHGSVDGT